MAHLIANQLSDRGETVPDPAIVVRTLRSLRTISAAEVRALVRKTGASRVVVGYAGWSSEAAISPPILLTVRAKMLAADFSDEQYSNASRAGDFESNATVLEPSLTPEQVVAREMPVLASALGLRTTQRRAVPPSPRKLAIPSSPLLPAKGAGADPIERAWFTQLLAASSPPFTGDSRDRLFESSLAIALAALHKDDDARLLAARAMFELGRRPAGLALMADRTSSAEERFLAARLSGDLPTMGREIEGILRPGPRLLAELELHSTKSWYGRLTDNKAKLADIARVTGSAPRNWQPLVAWAMEGLDRWARHSPVETKALLDMIAPISGFTIDDAARSKLITGKDPMESADFLVSGSEHARREIANMKSGSCCANGTIGAYRVGALEMIAEWTFQWIGHLGTFLGEVQGRPREAINFLEQFEAGPLQGHPGLAYARAEIYQRLENGSEPPGAKAKAGAEKIHLSHLILQWSSSQTDATAFARSMIIATPPSYAYDYPSQPNWANVMASAPAHFKLSEPARDAFRESRARQACENSTIFGWCLGLLSFIQYRSPKEAVALAATLEDRFRGSSQAAQYAASTRRASGDSDGELAALKAAVDAQPDQPDALLRYSSALSKMGRHKESAAIGERIVALGQRATGSDIVAYSGYVGAVADLLLLGGAVDEARPLLVAAARWQDGSARNMQTHSRLAIMDGRLRDAAMSSLQMITRYQNQDASFRYVALLHLLGDSSDANAASVELSGGSAKVKVSRALPVGWRMEADGLAAMQAWYDRHIKTANVLHSGDWKAPIMRLGLQDRSLKDIAMFREIYLRMATPTGTTNDTEMKRVFSSSTSHEPLRFIDGYAALKAGKAVEAVKILSASYKGTYLQEPAAAFLPYYIYAGAKAGDSAVANAPNTDTPPNAPPNPFWSNLGAAIRAALSGKHDEGLQKLQLAKANRHPWEHLLLHESYIIADIAEMLYEDTKHAPYLDFALDWARNIQRYEPWSSWAFAVEAKYAKNVEGRIRALAIAQHLDRRSAHLEGFDAKARAQATEWFAKNDPFGIKRPSAPAKRPQDT